MASAALAAGATRAQIVGGDTVLKMETSVFGSSTATPEIITITLVGVDAADIVMNNGIITA